MKEVIAKDLNEALQDPNTPFKACKPYVSLFEQYGNQFGGKHSVPTRNFFGISIVSDSSPDFPRLYCYAREFLQSQ